MLKFDPNTRRRIRRFAQIRRARWSLWLLLGIFLLSLLANFIANDQPLAVKCNGKWSFPALSSKGYSSDHYEENGVQTRPDYKELQKKDLFTENDENKMYWSPIRIGANEHLRSEEVKSSQTLHLRLFPQEKIASVDLDEDLIVRRSRGLSSVYEQVANQEQRLGSNFLDLQSLNTEEQNTLREEINKRFANTEKLNAAEFSSNLPHLILPSYSPRKNPPKLIKIYIRGSDPAPLENATLNDDFSFSSAEPSYWKGLNKSERKKIKAAAEAAMSGVPQALRLQSEEYGILEARLKGEKVSFPFRPVKGHPLGIDEGGRDVLVQILYATRTSLLFGLALVALTFFIGIIVGAVQGYFGGKLDMFGQRFIEIWESLPFLYIMIMISSIYGRSFGLLLALYAAFNWIGISYYLRAEFLKLRKQPFVESAKVMGLSRAKIMFRHVLPNALVPIITFFPFALVGAIFALTALTFLGFGLPPGTPSWGELLRQARVYPYAWWLVLYPALALFIISLLGVFIGEGLRAAFDPRSSSKLS